MSKQPTYLVQETIATEVIWTYEADAKSTEEAKQMVKAGRCLVVGDPIIGDQINNINTKIKIITRKLK